MNSGLILLARQLLEATRQCAVRLVRTRLYLGFWVLGLLGAVFLAFGIPDERLARIRGDEFTALVLYLLVLQFGTPLAGVHLAATSLRDDIDRGTLGILQTRAISRTTLLLGRFFGTSLVVGLSAVLILVLWFSALQSHGSAWRRGLGPQTDILAAMVKAVVMAVPSFTALGLFFGARLNRPIVATVMFVAGIEVFVSNLPVGASLRAWSPSDAMRQMLIVDLQPEVGSRLDRALRGLFDRVSEREAVAPWSVFLRVTGVGLLLGIWTFGSREYAARVRD